MRQTGGDALARQLVREGVEKVFGIPGVQLDWAVDGLRKVKDDISYVVARHEQATSYMADGYARTTGKVGVCMIVPGPGLLNAMAGLATAYACNSRVLCISGDIYSPAVGKGLGLLHEVRDQSAILSSVTKWNGRAERPEDIPGLVRRAFEELNSGPPLPVGIEISHDLLSATADIPLLDVPAAVAKKAPTREAVRLAAQLVNASEQPVIYLGGGVEAARAGLEVVGLAEKLQAPIVMGENGRGGIPHDHPLAFSSLEGRAIFPHSDLVVVVGSRFIDTANGQPAWPTDAAKYVYVNIDESVTLPPRRADAFVGGDCSVSLAQLADAITQRAPTSLPVDDIRDWADVQRRPIEPQGAWLRALRSALPDDGILVSELTQVGYFARIAYPVRKPGTYVTPGYQGTLGFGFPTALGAAVGNPGRPVVSINGDGGFGWGMQELATARKYNLNVAIVVFSDGYFGNVRKMQKDQFGEDFGVELYNPDFEALASAFSIPHVRVDDPDSLRAALERGFAEVGPTLYEVHVDSMPSPWHLLRLKTPPFASGSAAPPNPLGEPVTK